MNKKPAVYLFLFLLVIAFSGCPMATDHPLGYPGKEKIDKRLIGTWEAIADPANLAITKVKISQKDEYSYDVKVIGKGELFSEETVVFTGWVTELDKHQFIYFKPENGGKVRYYLYCYKMGKKKHDDFFSYDVGLLHNGVEKLYDTEEFRKEVSASLKISNCLTDETLWRRVKQ